MSKRNHLKRLPPEYYRSNAIVHWSVTVADRKEGWLNGLFYYRVREILTHTAFRYGVACPMFCLMPDHFHMLWMGLLDESDQLLGMKHFTKTLKESLHRIGYDLQDQAFDHVLKEEEKTDAAFHNVCDYNARNPERAGLVEHDEYRAYKYTGCLVPGYPQLRPSDDGFWDEFDRVISFLRSNGLFRSPKA